MCGIIHVKRFDKKPAKKMVYKRYQKQKTRGQEGFGYITIGDNVNTERSKNEKGILSSLLQENASEIMFHHRFPTSTPNICESTHPIVVKNKMLKHIYYVVHNGIITNDSTLRAKHIASGFEYTTDVTRVLQTRETTYNEPTIWNDSESLAIELALLLENKQSTIGTVGSVAFVCLQVDKKTKKPVKLYFGRNSGNPLKMDFNEHFISLSSEGSGQNILENYLYCLDYKHHKKISSEKLNIGTHTYYKSYYNNDYSDYGAKGRELEEDDFSTLMQQNDKYIELARKREKLEEGSRYARTLFDYDKEIAIQQEIDLIDEQIDRILECTDLEEVDGAIDELDDFDSYNKTTKSELDDF